jgi:transposase-like protein
MPLTKGLSDVLLSYPCPHCGHKQDKKGSWFQTIGQYTCLSCDRSVRIT